jgi:hypothetical protein
MTKVPNINDFDSVKAFIESSLSQADVATTIASGTIGLSVLIWASYFGLKRDIDTVGFRWISFLILPFVLCIFALICSYLLYALTTGYRYELLMGKDMSAPHDSDAICDPVRHFIDQYSWKFYVVSLLQIGSSVLATLFMWSWITANVLFRRSNSAKSKLSDGESC